MTWEKAPQLYLRSMATVASCSAVELLQGPLVFLKTPKEYAPAMASPFGRKEILLWSDQEDKKNCKIKHLLSLCTLKLCIFRIFGIFYEFDLPYPNYQKFP